MKNQEILQRNTRQRAVSFLNACEADLIDIVGSKFTLSLVYFVGRKFSFNEYQTIIKCGQDMIIQSKLSRKYFGLSQSTLQTQVCSLNSVICRGGYSLFNGPVRISEFGTENKQDIPFSRNYIFAALHMARAAHSFKMSLSYSNCALDRSLMCLEGKKFPHTDTLLSQKGKIPSSALPAVVLL